MNLIWTQDLPKEKRKEFEELVLGSGLVLDKLKKICYNRLKMLVENKSDKDYQNSAWPYLQAHQNGQIQELKAILEILNIKE